MLLTKNREMAGQVLLTFELVEFDGNQESFFQTEKDTQDCKVTLTHSSQASFDLIREDYNKRLMILEQEKEAIAREKLKYYQKRQKLKQEKKNFQSMNSQNIDQRDLVELEKIRQDIEKESERMQKQEIKVKNILDKLQNEKQRLKQEKQQLQRRKESIKRREESIILEQKRIEEEKQKLLQDQEEIQKLKEQINNERIKLSQEKNKLNATRNLLMSQQRKLSKFQNPLDESPRFAEKQNSSTDCRVDINNSLNLTQQNLTEEDVNIQEIKEQIEQEKKEIEQFRLTLQEKQRIFEQNARKLALEKIEFEREKELFMQEQQQYFKINSELQIETQPNTQFPASTRSLQCRTEYSKCPINPRNTKHLKETYRVQKKLNYSQE